MVRWTYALAVLCALFTTTAAASSPISQKQALDMDGRVVVRCASGAIEITAWDQPQVEVSGQLSDDAEAVDVSGDARRVVVEVRFPHKQRGGSDATLLKLQVPRTASLDVQSMEATIQVNGVQGLLLATSASGNINAQGDFQQVRLASASGALQLSGAVPAVDMRTVSGGIRADGISGLVRVETVSGLLEINGGGPLKSLRTQSVSGEQRLNVDLDTEGSIAVESLSGTADLRLARPLDATLSMLSENGAVSASVGGTPGTDPHQQTETLGSGAGHVRMHSFSGNLRIEAPPPGQAPAAAPAN